MGTFHQKEEEELLRRFLQDGITFRVSRPHDSYGEVPSFLLVATGQISLIYETNSLKVRLHTLSLVLELSDNRT